MRPCSSPANLLTSRLVLGERQSSGVRLPALSACSDALKPNATSRVGVAAQGMTPRPDVVVLIHGATFVGSDLSEKALRPGITSRVLKRELLKKGFVEVSWKTPHVSAS